MQKSHYTYRRFWHFVVIQIGAGPRLYFWGIPTTLIRLCGRSLLTYSNNTPKFDSTHVITAPITAPLGRVYGYNGISGPNYTWISLTPYSTWYTVTTNLFQRRAPLSTSVIAAPIPRPSIFRYPRQSDYRYRLGHSRYNRYNRYNRCYSWIYRFPRPRYVFGLDVPGAPALALWSYRLPNTGLSSR
jgi:hypothetical protein